MKKRTKASLEIAIVFSSILLFTWFTPVSLDMLENNRTVIIALFAFTILYLAYISPCLIFNDTLAIRGLGTWNTFFIRTDNLRSAFRGYGAITIIGAVFIVGYSLMLRPDLFSHLNWHVFFLKLGFYVFSALVQQLLFISWLLVRLRIILQDDLQDQTGSKRKQLLASVVAAIMVFLLHTPNLPVMFICLVSGFAVVWVSYTTPNLLLAISCHALLGTLLHRIAGIPIKFGPAYMHKDFLFFQTLFPFAKRVIGNLF